MQPLDHAGDAPNRDTFAQHLIDAVRQAGEKGPLKYDPESYTLEVENSSTNRASLGNLYKEYCLSKPEARAKIFRNFVRSWFAPIKGLPEEYEDAQHDLLPSVRPRAYIEVNSIKLQAETGKDIEWTHGLIGEHLCLALVYDLPESIMSVQKHHLDAWGVSFEDALDRAAINLLEMSRHKFHQPAPGVWQSPWKDNHDTARLILQPLIQAHAVAGDPVAMVPNRDTLLLTGSDDSAGLAALAKLAEAAFAHPRSVSGHALRLQEDTWVNWMPDEDHPEFFRFRRMSLRSLAGDYASQKHALDLWYEKQEPEDRPLVAPRALAHNEATGEVFTYAIWLEGTDTLLPQAERIALVRMPDSEATEASESNILGLVDWEQLVEVVGDLLVPQEEMYPLRYRAREFPSEAMLAELFG